ncbi:MAG: Flagellar hook-basal body complex protein FliE [Pseudomonadota bacterium]|jgi:flagellar hook-basal body complex protein FliE
MTDRVTSPANILSMLQTMSKLQAQASAGVEPEATRLAGLSQGSPSVDFGEMVRQAMSEVNETQQQSRSMQAAFERGEVPLTDVVIAMQKSSLAFEATLQMRNKVLKAYEDILNMPI